jgi:hypothetical protein
MKHASIAPSLDADIHLVLCRFGRAGLAYVETDPAEADATTVIQNLLYGRYGEPLRVVALNVVLDNRRCICLSGIGLDVWGGVAKQKPR